MSPLLRRMIEHVAIRNLSPATQAILRSRGLEVQPVFWLLARRARPGGRSRLPGPSGLAKTRLGVAQSGRLRLALLLARDACRTDDSQRLSEGCRRLGWSRRRSWVRQSASLGRFELTFTAKLGSWLTLADLTRRT
jgi:hypothetical protein